MIMDVLMYERWLREVPEIGTWGWLIALYLFLGGLGGATSAVGGLADLSRKKKFKSLAKIGTVTGPFLLAIGSALLLLELGNPLLGIFVPIAFINPTSWMAIGAWTILILIIVGIFYFLAWRRGTEFEKRKPLAILSVIMGLLTAIYTGFLLQILEFIPLWNNMLLPLLFLVSALSTGIGLTGVLALIIGKAEFIGKEGPYNLLAKSDEVIIIAEVVVLAAFLNSVMGANTAGFASVTEIISGKFSTIFWIGVIFLGIIVPIILSAFSTFGKKEIPAVIFIEFTSLLIGGLALRYVIVYSAIKVQPVFPTFI